MLTEQTARALVSARPFARIAGPGAAADADWVLDGFASALYADTRDAGKPVAELSITYYLTPRGRRASRHRVWTHEYHAPCARCATALPVAYADALNIAFGEIVAELAQDLARSTFAEALTRGRSRARLTRFPRAGRARRLE